MRVTFVFFWGRWGLPIPRRFPLVTCVGEPIPGMAFTCSESMSEPHIQPRSLHVHKNINVSFDLQTSLLLTVFMTASVVQLFYKMLENHSKPQLLSIPRVAARSTWQQPVESMPRLATWRIPSPARLLLSSLVLSHVRLAIEMKCLASSNAPCGLVHQASDLVAVKEGESLSRILRTLQQCFTSLDVLQ